jgi:hypothetical protein
MMEQVHSDKAGLKLWGGNRGGIWKMISIESVVGGIVNGIENRRDMVVLPKQNALIARAPGLFRPLIEAIGFKEKDVREAIEISTRR